MNAHEHYDRLFGDLGLHPQDAARWVFVSGWNSAMHIDPSEIQEKMQ